jgi:hypothetical protein
MILATTKVEDVDRFLEVFSTKGAEKRGQHGSKGSTVFRDPNEDNRVWVLFDWDDEGWRSFVSDPDVPGGGADRRSFLRRDRRVGRGCPTGWTAPTTRLRLPHNKQVTQVTRKVRDLGSRRWRATTADRHQHRMNRTSRKNLTGVARALGPVDQNTVGHGPGRNPITDTRLDAAESLLDQEFQHRRLPRLDH